MFKFSRQSNFKVLHLVASKSNFSQRARIETKIVDLPVGKVKGKFQVGICGHEYYSFEGIPFGNPPIGKLRFCAPQPADPWCGKVLDCLEERSRPVQSENSSGCTIGAEDCLYLNVYTKHFDTAKSPLPVIVYIHGGGFKTGGATRVKYGPDFLMREDIVYVQFSYRLCALGFLLLSCPDLGVPGNAGLHDQLLALRWTQKYISHFNGDPKNVTLMGTSAGAASVHFMMCLPEACGLFQRAIIMSGAMTCPWVQVPNTDSLFCRLANIKGYRGVMLESPILEFLRSLPAEELVQHELFGPREYIFGHLYPFVPTLEYQSGVEGLLKRPFLQMMRDAWSKEVPLLMGGTSFEGLVMYPHCKINNCFMLQLLKQEPALVLPYDVYRRHTMKDLNDRAMELINFHFGRGDINVNNIMQILDLFSYKLFWHCIHRVVLSRLAFAQAPTYLYRFDFDSPHYNLMRIKLCGNDIRRGVCHADELGYMFPRESVRKKPLNEAESLTIHRMVGILTSFARTGDPNCVETETENWRPVDRENPFDVMNIGHKVEFQPQCERAGIKVWNSIYDNDKHLLYGG
ncbi:esterase B1 [Drosophila novamexicana]|uniref:esterase B1 n=1 Tax=Drosophila novamexicana TaxID=47314 RepID=UPI0011E5F479|nr:esterase B1 [Drosophila novamexicana]